MTSKKFTITGTARTEGATVPLSRLKKSLDDTRKSADDVGKAFDDASKRAKEGAEAFRTTSEKASGFTSALKSIAPAAGAIGLVTAGAVSAAGAISDLADESLRVQNIFGNLPFSIEPARRATKGLVSDIELATAANQAAAIGIVSSAGEFARLAEAAQKLGQRVGIDGPRAFDSLVAGVGRGSTEMLDNLGIVLKTEQAHKIYAEQLGKTAGELTDVEKAEAFRKVALEKIFEAAEDVTIATDGAAAATQRYRVELENLRTAALGGENQSLSLAKGFEVINETTQVTAKSLRMYGATSDDVREKLLELGVASETVAGLTTDDLVKGITRAQEAEKDHLLTLASEGRLTHEYADAIQRVLGLMSESERTTTAFGRALQNVIDLQAAKASIDQLTGDLARNLAIETDRSVTALIMANGLADAGKKKTRGGRSRDNRTEMEKLLGLSAGSEGLLDAAQRGNESADSQFADLFPADRTVAPDFEGELERLRAQEQAKAEIILSERMRAVEIQQAEGVDPLQLIAAEEQARVEFLNGQLERSNDLIEQMRLEDQIKAEHHAADLKRMAITEERQRKHQALVLGYTHALQEALIGTGAAALQAALMGEGGVRAAVHSFARGKAIEMAVLAATETARGVAALASPFTAALAPGHFAAAGQAAAAGALIGVLAGVTAGGGGGGGVGFGGRQRGSEEPERGSFGPGFTGDNFARSGSTRGAPFAHAGMPPLSNPRSQQAAPSINVTVYSQSVTGPDADDLMMKLRSALGRSQYSGRV